MQYMEHLYPQSQLKALSDRQSQGSSAPLWGWVGSA